MPSAIHTDAAPAAIGPYSQAVVHDGLVFCSGQIALDPATMTIVAGDVQVQTERVMQNLHAVLAASGTDFEHVLRTTIYLTSMADFAAVNEVYGRYFEAHKPARACVAVRELPKGVDVEIDCIAARPS